VSAGLETSILFLLHAGKLWNLAESPVGRLGHTPPEEADDLRGVPGGEELAAQQAEWRRAVLDEGGEIESPQDRSIVDLGAVAITLFMSALWRLSEEGEVELTLGEPIVHEEDHGDWSLRWVERTIAASLAGSPNREWGAAEGGIIEALSDVGGAGEPEIVALGETVVGRSPPRRIHDGEALRPSPQRKQAAAWMIDICREAAVEKGFLSPAEPEDSRAVLLGVREEQSDEPGGGFFSRLLRSTPEPRVSPVYVRVRQERIDALAGEFERQNDAYLDYRKVYNGFEGRLNNYWNTPVRPYSDSGGGGGGG